MLINDKYLKYSYFIKISNPEHSKLVQNRLFELGFCWEESPQLIPKHLSGNYLSIRPNNRITYSINLTNVSASKQITYLDLYTKEFLKIIGKYE